MASLNKVMLIGNVGQDPELRYTPDGNPVANFSIAVNRIRRVGEEYKDETEWFNIIGFSRTAENVNQYLTKGQKVYVEGRFQSSEYVGQDGNQRKSFEVIANEVTFYQLEAKQILPTKSLLIVTKNLSLYKLTQKKKIRICHGNQKA